MLEKPATTTYDIHPLLRHRWSPRAFAPQEIPPEQVLSLLEAARWAPSAINEQPWNFIVAPHSDAQTFEQALSCLVDGNRVWAQHVPLLLVAVARTTFSRDGSPNPVALYDLGQAVAGLTVQASSLGLWVHQMAGFVADRTRTVFAIPDDYTPVTFIAIGQLGDPATLPEQLRERELAQRARKPLEQFVFGGNWGEPSPLLGEAD